MEGFAPEPIPNGFGSGPVGLVSRSVWAKVFPSKRSGRSKRTKKREKRGWGKDGDSAPHLEMRRREGKDGEGPVGQMNCFSSGLRLFQHMKAPRDTNPFLCDLPDRLDWSPFTSELCVKSVQVHPSSSFCVDTRSHMNEGVVSPSLRGGFRGFSSPSEWRNPGRPSAPSLAPLA